MKNSLNYLVKYWIIFIVIFSIFSIFIWKYIKNIRYINKYELFEQQKANWIETLKCLGFNNDDLNQFQKHLSSGDDPNVLLNKLMHMASQKKLKDDEIFKCLHP